MSIESPDFYLLQPKAEREAKHHYIRSGTYIPPGVLTNEEMARWNIRTKNGVLSADDIARKTGVLRRYYPGKGETVLSMALSAFDLANGRFDQIDLDALITTTSFPLGYSLSDEINEKRKLNASYHIDIHAACSGSVEALAHVHNNKTYFNGKTIGIIASEDYSPYLLRLDTDEAYNPNDSLKDPSLAQTIFSSGASSLIFTLGRDLDTLSSVSSYLYDPGDNLRMPVDWNKASRHAITRFVPQSEKFLQNGRRVYEMVVEQVPPLIYRTIENVGISEDEVKLIIPHQGSLPVVMGLSKRIPKLTFALDIEEGNFSSVSTLKAFGKAIYPSTLQYVRDGKVLDERVDLSNGDVVVVSGFGAGPYSSNVALRLHNLESKRIYTQKADSRIFCLGFPKNGAKI